MRDAGHVGLIAQITLSLTCEAAFPINRISRIKSTNKCPHSLDQFILSRSRVHWQ